MEIPQVIFSIKQNQIITMEESQNVEYKESWRDEYLKWICGFANAQGGRIYIGIRDDGSVNGVPDAARLLEDIPNKIRNSMGILADVNLLNREGKKRRRNYCSACRLPGKLPRRISLSLRQHQAGTSRIAADGIFAC